MEQSCRPVASARSLLVGLCVAVVLAGACNKTGRATPPRSTSTAPTTTSTAPATTTTVDVTEAAVLDGYRAFWRAYLKAGDPMDPKHPDLLATATGEQLDQVKRAFLARLVGGEVIRGTIETHPRLDGPVQATTAAVTDCYVDDSHLFDAATGTRKDDPAVVNQQVRAEMTLVGSTWKVSAIRHVAKGCTPA